MIQNKWRVMLERAGVKQNDLADRVGENKGVMSMVCNGIRILPLDKLSECADSLGCAIMDIYDMDTLRILYGITANEEPVPEEKKRTVRVTLEPDVACAVDDMVDAQIYKSRYEAVNALIRPACRSYRGGA